MKRRVEVAEDRLWRSSSSRFNTGGPVLKELLSAWRPGEEEEGKPVCRDPQGGGERASEGGEGWGLLQSAALCSRQALSGHTITQVGRASNRKKTTKQDEEDGDPPCWIQ